MNYYLQYNYSNQGCPKNISTNLIVFYQIFDVIKLYITKATDLKN